MQVLRKRIIDAWMDTFHPDPPDNPDCQLALIADNAGMQADGLVAQQQVVQAGFRPQPIVLFAIEEGLERWNNRRRAVHRDNFPLSDHLFTLMTIVQADLTEQQRERLTSHLAIRGIPLPNYTFDLIRTACLELFLHSEILIRQSFFPSFQPAKDLPGSGIWRTGRQHRLLGSCRGNRPRRFCPRV